MNTVYEIRLLQKQTSGQSVMLRWSDESDIIGYGLTFEMAAADLNERRDKAGLSNRPTALPESPLKRRNDILSLCRPPGGSPEAQMACTRPSQ